MRAKRAKSNKLGQRNKGKFLIGFGVVLDAMRSNEKNSSIQSILNDMAKKYRVGIRSLAKSNVAIAKSQLEARKKGRLTLSLNKALLIAANKMGKLRFLETINDILRNSKDAALYKKLTQALEEGIVRLYELI